MRRYADPTDMLASLALSRFLPPVSLLNLLLLLLLLRIEDFHLQKRIADRQLGQCCQRCFLLEYRSPAYCESSRTYTQDATLFGLILCSLRAPTYLPTAWRRGFFGRGAGFGFSFPISARQQQQTIEDFARLCRRHKGEC